MSKSVVGGIEGRASRDGRAQGVQGGPHPSGRPRVLPARGGHNPRGLPRGLPCHNNHVGHYYHAIVWYKQYKRHHFLEAHRPVLNVRWQRIVCALYKAVLVYGLQWDWQNVSQFVPPICCNFRDTWRMIEMENNSYTVGRIDRSILDCSSIMLIYHVNNQCDLY